MSFQKNYQDKIVYLMTNVPITVIKALSKCCSK